MRPWGKICREGTASHDRYACGRTGQSGLDIRAARVGGTLLRCCSQVQICRSLKAKDRPPAFAPRLSLSAWNRTSVGGNASLALLLSLSRLTHTHTLSHSHSLFFPTHTLPLTRSHSHFFLSPLRSPYPMAFVRGNAVSVCVCMTATRAERRSPPEQKSMTMFTCGCHVCSHIPCVFEPATGRRGDEGEAGMCRGRNATIKLLSGPSNGIHSAEEDKKSVVVVVCV